MINAYDFDGTIYDGDSSVDFFLYSLKRKPSNIILMPIQLWGVLLYLLKIKDKDYMKEKLFCFVKRIDTKKYVKDFWKTHTKKIKDFYLKQKKDTDIIISASPEFLLKPLESIYNFKVIATKVDENTGKFISKNCHDYEKIIRYEKETKKKNNIKSFYSDSFKSDYPMLEYAKEAYLVKKDRIIRINTKKEKEKVKKKINKILLLVLIIICFILLYFINKNNPVTAKETVNNNNWNYKVPKTENVLFLGDSITEWYPLEDFFENVPIVNSGKAGNTIEDILNNMKERVYIYNPTKVFIQIGTNDIKKQKKDNNSISSNINKIIKGIKKNRPEAKIYVISLYPINDSDNEKINKENVLPRANNEIERINNMIKDVCKKQNITYIDIYKELISEDKELNLKYTTDGLHLSDLGYFKVTKVLLPYVVN